MEKLPVFSVDLVAELDKVYPEACPNPDDSDREIWLKAGRRDVVRFLLAKVRQIQDDNLLEN